MSYHHYYVEPEWRLADYRTARGEAPVRQFLEKLPEEAQAEAGALILLVQRRGNALRLPHSRALGGGLFELRGQRHAVRIFYMFLPGRRIMLLDGMVKKQDAIPDDVLQRMRRLCREIVEASKKKEKTGRRKKGTKEG